MRIRRRLLTLVFPLLALLLFMGLGLITPLLNPKRLDRHAELPINTVREALEEKVAKSSRVESVLLEGHGRIVYEVGGRGEPVLLLHCWAGSKEYWKYVIRDLGDQFRFYAPDLKGFGDSDKPPSGYRISDYVDLIRELCEAVGVERASIVGHSLGGAIAARFAATYPQAVDKLVLVATPPKGLPLRLRIIGYPVIGVLWYGMIRAIGGFALRGSAAGEVWLKPTIRSATRSMKWYSRARVVEDLKRVKAPTLLIFGLKDRTVPPESAYIYAEVKRSYVAIIPDSKHSPMCENPPAFNEVLRSFLLQPLSLSAGQ